MATVYGDLYDATLQKLAKRRSDLASELGNIDKCIDALKVLANGGKPEETEPLVVELVEQTAKRTRKSPEYDDSVRKAPSNKEAAITIMRTLNKPVGSSDIAGEFKRVGRPATKATVSSILAHMKEARRVGKGLYRLR